MMHNAKIMSPTIKRRELREEVDWPITVTIARNGHTPAIPNGAMVRCAWMNDVPLHGELDCAVMTNEAFTNMRRLKMKDAGVGTVMDRIWHVDHLELMNAEVVASWAALPANLLLQGAAANLWYHVLFSAGFFWVRFDWIVDA